MIKWRASSQTSETFDFVSTSSFSLADLLACMFLMSGKAATQLQKFPCVVKKQKRVPSFFPFR